MMAGSENKIEPRFEAVIKEFSNGNVPRALELAGKLVSQDPTNHAAWHALGLVNLNASNSHEAFSALSRASAIAPFNSTYYGDKGKACLILGQLERARECLHSSHALEPDDHEIQTLLSKIGVTDFPTINLNDVLWHEISSLIDAAELSDVTARQEEIMAEASDDPRLRYALALSAQGRNDLDEVISQLHAVVRSLPAFAQANKALADFLWMRDRLRTARAEALRLFPARFLKTRNFQDLEFLEICYDRAVAHDPDNAEGHTYFANYLRSQGRERDAAWHYELALTLIPNDQFVIFNRVSQAEDLERAINLVTLYPNFAEARRLAARLLSRAGNTVSAGRQYLAGLKLPPTATTDAYFD